MPDDLERRLPDVPAAFPRPDVSVTNTVRAKVLGLRRPLPRRSRLGVVAAAMVCAAASVGFTAGHWLLPSKGNAATSVSIIVRPLEVTVFDYVSVYGVAGGRPGEPVSVEARECRAYGGFHLVAGAQTGSGGAWSTQVKAVSPGITTTYRARWKDQVSDSITVRVHPDLFLRKLQGGVFDLWVRGNDIFRGEIAAVERLAGGGWIVVKHIRVKSWPGGYNYGGEVRFRVKLGSGTAVRVVLSQAQVGRCFLPGFSNIVRV